MTSSESEERILFGGVYAAIPNRLVVGPYTRAETFATRQTGFLFADMPLPEPSSRYVISCLLPTTALSAQKASPSPQPSPRPRSSAEPSDPATATATIPNGPTVAMEASQPVPTDKAIASARSSVADFVAQMNARRQQQRSTAGKPGITTGMPLSFARSVEKARSRKAEQQGVPVASAGAPESVVRQLALDNDDIRAAVEKALGSHHFLQCVMTQGSLDDIHDVTEACEHIAEVLQKDPQAMIYIYSGTGRNRASALAMHYLQRNEKLPLREIFSRMPTSTPQISSLVTLIARDKNMRGDGTASFDEDEYFYLYFTRRYPHKGANLIKAAVETRPGDFAGMDALLHDQLVFTMTSTQTAALVAGTRHRSTPAGGTVAVGDGEHISYNTSFGSCAAVMEPPGSGARFVSGLNPPSSSDVVVADDCAPVVLTSLDEEIIASVCKALQSAGMPASRAEVTESYVRHRRNRHRVLSECLTKHGVRAASKVALATSSDSVGGSLAPTAAGDGSTR